ncbi:MAG: tRNA preQ1(34) S-adenosylmethionine ribosyltransferase-isomerase QueA [Rickettsiales bacterium]
MKTSLFDFHLPPERIAHHPVEPRDAARLLHVEQTGLSDHIVRDLPQLLNSGDVLVFNDSKVIPARLFAEINGKQVEVLLHQPCTQNVTPSDDGVQLGEALKKRDPVIQRGDSSKNIWSAFAKPARKLKPGMVLPFAADFSATVEGRTKDGQVLLRFADSGAAFFNKLRAHGHMPLPPYIERADNANDATRYQTVYAAREGSVAAPTAGLHFTPELLAALNARGVHTAFVTLHVGAGTFQPVKVDDTDEHVMHREWIEVTAEAAHTINTARAAGGRVVAVGTTSLRVLESVAQISSPLQREELFELQPYFGETGIFITPGYRFKIVDALMTNFHLPKSTLFMLVSAFAGLERMHAAYAHAIAQGYRFYSYGDTSLLERAA